MTTVKKHPEQADDEIFVGNHNLKHWPDPKLAALKTARLGNVAYFIDGGKIPESMAMRPLFIGAAEGQAYDVIMTAAFRAIRGLQ